MPSCLPLLRSALLASAVAFGAAPAFADANPYGAYLAARLAASQNDYAAAVSYYDRLLVSAPTDPSYQEGALVSHVAIGDCDRAAAIAKLMTDEPGSSEFAVLVSLAADARSGDFAGGIGLLDSGDKAGGVRLGKLTSGLYRAWALAGEGKMTEAAQAFDDVAKAKDLAGFASYHKALALAMVGDYEGADQIFSGKLAPVLHSTRRGVLAHVEILSQLERDKDALALFDQGFGKNLDPELGALRARLVKGDMLPFTIAPNARAGVAELYLTVAQALAADQPSAVALIHARLAAWIRPDLGDATLLAASVLEQEGRHDLAIDAYGSVPEDSPVYSAAQLGRASALSADGQDAEAIEVLEGLTKALPDLAPAWGALGDDLRQAERYPEAVDAYNKAIALVGTPPEENDWFLYFARGIAEDKAKDWAASETDMREALKLKPDQPSVLNYLGYSYVDKGENLDEALEMIRRAAKERPDEGYIIDSLGWAYFRLGRYEEAVTAMEKAVGLEPTEPLLNDHLGDVYWAVGRRREAEFQWRRALNLGPGDDLDMDRVRRKLEVGLDAVLKEEGAAPLQASGPVQVSVPSSTAPAAPSVPAATDSVTPKK